MRQKRMLVKQVGDSKIIFGDINSPSLVTDRTSSQKVKESIEDLNAINQRVLIDIYRTVTHNNKIHLIFKDI